MDWPDGDQAGERSETGTRSSPMKMGLLHPTRTSRTGSPAIRLLKFTAFLISARRDGHSFEEFYYATLQRILRAHDQKPVFALQALEQLRAVTQLVGGQPDVGAHPLAQEGVAVVGAFEQGFDRRAHAIDDRAEIA